MIQIYLTQFFETKDWLLKAEKSNIDPDSRKSSEKWKYWINTFGNFITDFYGIPVDGQKSKLFMDPEKLKVLINNLSPPSYNNISNIQWFYSNLANFMWNLLLKFLHGINLLLKMFENWWVDWLFPQYL